MSMPSLLTLLYEFMRWLSGEYLPIFVLEVREEKIFFRGCLGAVRGTAMLISCSRSVASKWLFNNL